MEFGCSNRFYLFLTFLLIFACHSRAEDDLLAEGSGEGLPQDNYDSHRFGMSKDILKVEDESK